MPQTVSAASRLAPAVPAAAHFKRFGLTIAAMIRNEGRYLAEWIEYHTLVGFEHVYLYDNDSTDDTREIVRDYVVQGRATLIAWPEATSQTSAYNHAIKVFGRDSAWMALIDPDEFVRVDAGVSLRDLLEGLGDVDQVLMPWVHFGSSGHEDPPDSLVVEAYTWRVETAHRQPKAIVRPDAVVWAEVHHCLTRAARTVDPAGTPLPERWILDRPPEGAVRLHHYFTKSRTEFAAKIARGQADGGRGKTMDAFERFTCPVPDDSLARFGPAVRAALRETQARTRKPHVHAAWSAQSEIAPSRSWTLRAHAAIERLRAAFPPGIAADTERSIGVARLSVPHGYAPQASEAIDTVRRDLAAVRVCDAIEPGEERHVVHATFGRPFVALTASLPVAATIEVVATGSDAGGKPVVARLSLGVPAGDTVAFAIVSQRTMTVESVTATSPVPFRGFSAELYTFV